MKKTNQEIKFFSVEIGTETRRGNFMKHHSFVCKTQIDTMDIHKHYREKYHGFDVNVESINEVVSLDQKEEIKNTVHASKKITTFISKIGFEKFSDETQDKLIEFNESRKEHKRLGEILGEILKKEIKERNSLITSVRLNQSIPDEFNGRTYVELTYTANLDGHINEYTEREIKEED